MGNIIEALNDQIDFGHENLGLVQDGEETAEWAESGNGDEKSEENLDKTEEEKNAAIKHVLSDLDIKSADSPFRIFPDEMQEFDGSAQYIDLNRTIQQYRNGEITERMMDVLGIVIHQKSATSRQIWQLYLLNCGKYIKRANLNRLLRHMVKLHLIAQCWLKSAVGKASYFVYLPDYNGIRLYTTVENENTDWKKTDLLQKAYSIKRSLAATQFLVAFLKNYELAYRAYPLLSWAKGNGVDKSGSLRPALEFTFKTSEMESIVFLVEAVRSYDGWREGLSEKLVRYGDYLKSIEDTQRLKKYYLVFCAETDEHLKGIVQLLYEAIYKKHIHGLKDTMTYFVKDTDVLDINVKTDLLHSLYGYFYNKESGKWVEFQPDFSLPVRDLKNLEVDMGEPSTDADADASGRSLSEKEKLAVRIYRTVEASGLEFPVSVTTLALPLARNGIAYREMGYKRLKGLFDDLEVYYIQNYKTPTELMLTPTGKLTDIIMGIPAESSENEAEDTPEDNTGETWKGNPENMHTDISAENGDRQRDSFTPQQAHSDVLCKNIAGTDIIEKYVIDGMPEKKKWRQQLHGSVYITDWGLSVALLGKLTQIDDFSPDGWYNIVAYAYHDALHSGLVRQNENYLCFKTGIKTASNADIYFLARKNYRTAPKWMLLGIATAESKRLGDIIREQFADLI